MQRLHGEPGSFTSPSASPGMCSLSTGEVHLWLAYYDEIADARLHERYRNLLSQEERQQQARFHFVADRLGYLVTRALVRTVLSRYVDLDATCWRFSKNAYGRPDVVNPEAHNLSFNLSHTRHLIVLAVSRDRIVGVDVENIALKETPLALADRFFSFEEAAALARLPADLQQYRFFEYWTCKEAYIKARGMGLSIPLDKFSILFPDAPPGEIAIQREFADDSRDWRFCQVRPKPEYLIAICAERSGVPQALTVRNIVPLAWEEVVTRTEVRDAMVPTTL